MKKILMFALLIIHCFNFFGCVSTGVNKKPPSDINYPINQFFEAVKSGNDKLVTAVLKFHPQFVTQKDPVNEETALMKAIPTGYDITLRPPNYLEVVRILIINNAEINAINKYGWTPLHYASASRGWSTPKERSQNSSVLIRNYSIPDPVPVMTSIRNLIIRNNANINARTSNDATPLFLAVHYDNEEAVKFLVAHGADKELRANTDMGPKTPLEWAEYLKRDRIVSLLKE